MFVFCLSVSLLFIFMFVCLSVYHLFFISVCLFLISACLSFVIFHICLSFVFISSSLSFIFLYGFVFLSFIFVSVFCRFNICLFVYHLCLLFFSYLPVYHLFFISVWLSVVCGYRSFLISACLSFVIIVCCLYLFFLSKS